MQGVSGTEALLWGAQCYCLPSTVHTDRRTAVETDLGLAPTYQPASCSHHGQRLRSGLPVRSNGVRCSERTVTAVAGIGASLPRCGPFAQQLLAGGDRVAGDGAKTVRKNDARMASQLERMTAETASY